MEYTSFANSSALDNHWNSVGYVPGQLVQRIKSGEPFPDVSKSDSYAFKYYAKHGGFDAKSTSLTTLATDDSSYALNSVFMTSFRECVDYVFRQIENSDCDSILMPAGGIPYAVPNTKHVTVVDNAISVEDLQAAFPNGTFINDDVNTITGIYDTICCMGFVFYLDKESIASFIKKMGSHVSTGSTFFLNYINRSSKWGAGVDGFSNALAWNIGVLSNLTTKSKFQTTFLTREMLEEMCDGLFEVVDVYEGTLSIHAIATLKAL